MCVFPIELLTVFKCSLVKKKAVESNSSNIKISFTNLKHEKATIGETRTVSHLGRVITTQCSDSIDITERKNFFVDQANNMLSLCIFAKLDSLVSVNCLLHIAPLYF